MQIQSPFNAVLSDAQMQIAGAGMTSNLWTPEFGWNYDELEASEDPHQPQILAGLLCFLHMFVARTKCSWIHLAAEMQAGKTGVVNALLRLIFANINTLHISPQRVFIITGMNDLAWVKQTKARVPGCVRNGVVHNGGLENIVTTLNTLAKSTESGILDNILIINDESHLASNIKNRPNCLIYSKVAELCPPEQWEAKNIRFLTISATDPAKVAAMEESIIHTKIVRLYTSEAYQSVDTLKELGRIRYAEDFGDLDQQRAINELARAITEDFPTPLYHILRPRSGKQARVAEMLKASFPGCNVVPWDANNRPTSAADGSSSMMEDINDTLSDAPPIHTFILLKNMFYASKTMNDTHVGILYDRVGGKDDTNLQSLLGRACGYGKSKRTIVYTSRQTVDNYLQFWMAVIKGENMPLTDIPIEKLDKKMAGTRVTYDIIDRQYKVSPTQAIAVPGGTTAIHTTGNTNGKAQKESINEDNFTSEWKEFTSFEQAKEFCKNIRKPKSENGFYLSSLTPTNKICRYDEVIAMKGGKKTANLDVGDLNVGKSRYRLYTCYKDINDTASVIFFVRCLTRNQ